MVGPRKSPLLHQRHRIMNPYQKAVKALEDCVKDAMENDIDAPLQMEIWRHYQGVKAIARQLKESDYQFNLNTDDYIPYDIGDSSSPVNFGAAEAVPFSSYGQDTITFS